MSFNEYSRNPSENTSIAGISLAPGGPPGTVENAIRQLMSDGRVLADVGECTDATAWFVAPNGTSSSAGTMAAPWSFAWAIDVANTAIQPGDTVYLRGGTYPTPIEEGFRMRKAGLPGKPITYAAFPGETPVIDAQTPIVGGFTLVSSTPGKDIYETNQPVVTPGVSKTIGASILLAGQWYPLMPERFNDTSTIDADSHTYSPNAGYYTGPTIGLMASGKLRIRLNPPTAQAMINRAVPAVASLSPNDNQIAFSRQTIGLSMQASYITIDGIQIVNALYSVSFGATCYGVRFVNGFDRPTYCSFNNSGGYNCTVDNWVSDGCMREPWWISYGDIKGGLTRAEPVRKLWMRGDANTADGWKITRCTIKAFFDGDLSQGTNFEYGGHDNSDPLNEDEMWAYANRFENIWDDAFQIYSTRQGLHIHHNYFYGAGVSRDGSLSGTDHGANWPAIHHNIFDPRPYPIFFNRYGAVDADTGQPGLTGLAYSAATSQHGQRNGAGYWTFPWRFYQNTVIVKYPAVNAFNLALFSVDAASHSGGYNLSGNNLLLATSDNKATKPSPIYYDLRADTGREIYDGDYIATDLPGWVVANPGNQTASLVRFVKIGGAAQDDGTSGNGFATVAALKGSVPIQTASKAYYAPGWFNSATQAALAPEAVIDSQYRPIAAAAKTGAAELTTLHLPGLALYQPWRGAKAPL